MKPMWHKSVWRPLPWAIASGPLASGLLSLSLPCWAQSTDGLLEDWRITPRISVGTTYSDNIRLAPAGDAEGDLVLQADPGISVRKRGGRLDLRLDYTAEGLLYANNGNASTINNSLLAFGTAELYQNHLFLDTYGSISQVSVTSGSQVDANLGTSGNSTSGGVLGLLNFNMGILPGATDLFNSTGIFGNIALTGNDQTTAANFGISPSWHQNFGSWAKALLRYRYNDASYGQNQFDSETQTITFNLDSGTQFGRLGWSIAYSHQQQDGNQSGNNQDSENNNLQGAANIQKEAVSGQLNYKLSNAWKLLAEAGYDNNTGYTDNRNGAYWGLGAQWAPGRYYSLAGLYGLNFNKAIVQWTPSPRTKLQVSRTYQEVGASPGVYWNGLLNYRSRHTIWSATYTQEVTTVQQLLGNSLTGLGSDGQPIALDEQNQNIISGGSLGLTNQPFLRKFFNLRVAYQRGRNGMSINAFSENREFQDASLNSQDTNLNNEETYGVGGVWTWRFAPRTASFLGTGWEHDDLADDQQNDYWVSVIGLARVFTADSGGLISYRYYQNDADPADQSFRENRLNVRFSMKF